MKFAEFPDSLNRLHRLLGIGVHPAFLEMAQLPLADALGFLIAKPELHGAVAVVFRVFTWSTRFGPTSTTVTGVITPSAS